MIILSTTSALPFESSLLKSNGLLHKIIIQRRSIYRESISAVEFEYRSNDVRTFSQYLTSKLISILETQMNDVESAVFIRKLDRKSPQKEDDINKQQFW